MGCVCRIGSVRCQGCELLLCSLCVCGQFRLGAGGCVVVEYMLWFCIGAFIDRFLWLQCKV